MLVSAERGRLEYLGKNLFEQGKNQHQTQPTYGLASATQQHKCKASGLFLAFHLQLTRKRAQIFASANEANLFVRPDLNFWYINFWFSGYCRPTREAQDSKV